MLASARRLFPAIAALAVCLRMVALPPAGAETKAKANASASANAKEEWHLVQQHEQFGVYNIYWTDDAIKVASDIGVSFICRGPAWRISPVLPQPACDALLASYKLMPVRGLVYRAHVSQLPNKRKSSLGHPDSWRLDVTDERTKDADFLATRSVRKIPYNARDFEYPRGYRAGSRLDLYTSNEQKKSLDNAFGDMGLGEKFGTK